MLLDVSQAANANFIYLILANIYHVIKSYRKKNFLIKIRTAKLTEPNRHLAEAETPELTLPNLT